MVSLAGRTLFSLGRQLAWAPLLVQFSGCRPWWGGAAHCTLHLGVAGGCAAQSGGSAVQASWMGGATQAMLHDWVRWLAGLSAWKRPLAMLSS